MVLAFVREHRAALAYTAAVGVALCVLPMVQVLGPESALALGVLLPPLAAITSARLASALRTQADAVDRVFARSLRLAWLWVVLPVLLLGLNALWVRSCDPLGGLAFMLLGPVCGVSLAAVVGAASGLWIASRRLAVGAALSVPLLAIVVTLYDFWSTPAVFAFGHFFGYFPGTLYDRSVTVPDAWLWMRGVTLLIGVSIYAGTRALWTPNGLDVNGFRRAPGLCATAGGAALLSVIFGLHAERWGVQTSSTFIASQLGRKLRSERCVLVVPRELPMKDALLLAEDCDFQLTRLERSLGVHVEKPVTAYFFRDRAEKRRLMGAGRVYVAKPWRDEVYLQLAGWPHPVLAHELAHVVAGRTGSGPFRIAGVWGGYRPEPTLIEGMAVALAFRAREGLTPHQWARAAREAGVATPLEQLVGTGFFAHNQTLGYTLTGSFLRFILESRGAEVLRDIYRSGDVEAATRASIQTLQAEWHAMLDATPLPDAARALAALRFEPPGVLSEVCPHEVERLRLELRGAVMAGDHSRVVERCQDILRIDPRHSESQVALVGALARSGDVAAAEQALRRLERAPMTPRVVLTRARTELADAAWRAGDVPRALALVQQLREEPQSEDARRVLEVKALGLTAPPRQRELIRELLVGDGDAGTDARVATHVAHRLAELRHDGLGDYLLARQLLNAGRYGLAYPALRRALQRGLPLSRLTREALALHGQSAFALGYWSEATRSFESLAAHADATHAQRAEAEDWLERLNYVREKGAIAKAGR